MSKSTNEACHHRPRILQDSIVGPRTCRLAQYQRVRALVEDTAMVLEVQMDVTAVRHSTIECRKPRKWPSCKHLLGQQLLSTMVARGRIQLMRRMRKRVPDHRLSKTHSSSTRTRQASSSLAKIVARPSPLSGDEMNPVERYVMPVVCYLQISAGVDSNYL